MDVLFHSEHAVATSIMNKAYVSQLEAGVFRGKGGLRRDPVPGKMNPLPIHAGHRL